MKTRTGNTKRPTSPSADTQAASKHPGIGIERGPSETGDSTEISSTEVGDNNDIIEAGLRYHDSNKAMDPEPQELQFSIPKDNNEAVLTCAVELGDDYNLVKVKGNKGNTGDAIGRQSLNDIQQEPNGVIGGNGTCMQELKNDDKFDIDDTKQEPNGINRGNNTELKNKEELAVQHEIGSFARIMDAVVPLSRVKDLLWNRDGEERVKTVELVGHLSTKPALLKHLLYISFHPSKPNLHNLALADLSQFKFYQGCISNGSGAAQSFFLIGQVMYSDLFDEDNSKQICIKPLYSHWARSAAVIGSDDATTSRLVPINGRKHRPVPVFDCKGSFQLTKYHKTTPLEEDPEIGSFVAIIFTIGRFKDGDHFVVSPNIQVVLCLGDKKDDLIEEGDIPKDIRSLQQFGVKGSEVTVKKEIEVEDEPSEDDKDTLLHCTPSVSVHFLCTVPLCLHKKMVLPLDIYSEIALFIDDRTVLCELTLSSCAARNACQPILWEHVDISNIHNSGSMYLWFIKNVHLARETQIIKLFGPGRYSRSQKANWLQLHHLLLLLSTGHNIVSVEVAQFDLESIPSSLLSPLLSVVIGNASF
ncbi:hypothetical protein EV421DRAFT_1742354 [Armillaria borealis]|uniref:Uncharacterized protein n=1 Tax=Armillaria borealis TaxID=47425 RepID=A0AA39IZ65_9AGAR|nr:hypothetical protein EV421DRAFT_1742354 [Armillaria borealis]